jgi:hypothetical protein
MISLLVIEWVALYEIPLGARASPTPRGTLGTAWSIDGLDETFFRKMYTELPCTRFPLFPTPCAASYAGFGFCLTDPKGYNLSQIVKQTWPSPQFVNWQINDPGQRILADTLISKRAYCCRGMAICADPRIYCVPNPYGRSVDVACVECAQGLEWKMCPSANGGYECRKLGTLSDVRIISSA